MTFDDGIVFFYKVTNVAENGKKPVKGLESYARHHFGFRNLGIIRYYTALQAHQQIESVIDIPGWELIPVESIAILDSGLQYTVQLAQPTTDENGLKITRISLERNGESYVIVS